MNWTRLEGNAGSFLSHNVAMPATVGAGAGLFVFAVADTSTPEFSAPPSGWSLLTETAVGRRFGLFAKVATGAEGGTNVNFQTNIATFLRTHLFHIPAAEWGGDLTGASIALATATGNSTDPDPPNVASGWTEPSLAIAAASPASSSTSPTYPAGYTDGDNQSGVVMSAVKDFDGSAEDPPAFTTNNGAWGAMTLLIRGVEAEAPALEGDAAASAVADVSAAGASARTTDAAASAVADATASGASNRAGSPAEELVADVAAAGAATRGQGSTVIATALADAGGTSDRTHDIVQTAIADVQTSGGSARTGAAAASAVAGVHATGVVGEIVLTEAQRAAEYRRKMQAREDNRLTREKAMAGDPAAFADLQERWSALLPWDGWDPEIKVDGEPK